MVRKKAADSGEERCVTSLKTAAKETTKRMTSRQKERHHDKRKKTHDKKNNLTTKIRNNHDLTAKEKRIKMSPWYRRNFAVSLFLFAMRFSFC